MCIRQEREPLEWQACLYRGTCGDSNILRVVGYPWHSLVGIAIAFAQQSVLHHISPVKREPRELKP